MKHVVLAMITIIVILALYGCATSTFVKTGTTYPPYNGDVKILDTPLDGVNYEVIGIVSVDGALDTQYDLIKLMQKVADNYQKYFDKYIPGLEFQKIASTHNDKFATILSEWKNSDGSSSIKLRISARWTSASGGGLGVSSDPLENINISYDTTVYHDGKRYKVSQRDFGWNKLSGQMSDPKEVFPEKAMKRIASKTRSSSKFVRRDAEGFIQNQLGGKYSSDNQWSIPIDEKTSLFLLRSVFMRQAGWNLNGIYQKNDAGYHTKRIAYDGHSFPETMEAFKNLKDYVLHLRKGGNSSDFKKFFKKDEGE